MKSRKRTRNRDLQTVLFSQGGSSRSQKHTGFQGDEPPFDACVQVLVIPMKLNIAIPIIRNLPTGAEKKI
jgi:hypothetical protein